MINVKYLNELYDELLNILQDSHIYKREALEKMFGEQRNSKKVKAILDNWDVFDYVSSDDPSIDHKYNRDYLWNKIRDDSPDGAYAGNYDELDTDNDGDVDKTDVSNIARAIMRSDVGRLTSDHDHPDRDYPITPDDWDSAHNGFNNIKMR